MKTYKTAYRFTVGLALAAAFILVWLIGAVGVIGAEGDLFDLMYFEVLAVGIIGVTSRASSHMEWHARCSRRRSLRCWSP